MNEHSFKYFLAILSLISANRKLEPLSSISDISPSWSELKDLLILSPPSPVPRPTRSMSTSSQLLQLLLNSSITTAEAYPPPNLQQSAKERRLNQLKGEGLVSKSAEGKGEDLKSGKERGRGWIWTSWPHPTHLAPKLTQSLEQSPKSRSLHLGFVWEMKLDAGFNLNILFCIICPQPLSRRCWYQGNLAQRHLNRALSDIHEAKSWRYLLQKYHQRWR